jgi:hypothetical protein
VMRIRRLTGLARLDSSAHPAILQLCSDHLRRAVEERNVSVVFSITSSPALVLLPSSLLAVHVQHPPTLPHELSEAFNQTSTACAGVCLFPAASTSFLSSLLAHMRPNQREHSMVYSSSDMDLAHACFVANNYVVHLVNFAERYADHPTTRTPCFECFGSQHAFEQADVNRTYD